MTTIANEEVLRLRATIDRGDQELFERLSNCKRPHKELVHLARVGLQLHLAARGKVSFFAQQAGPQMQQEADSQDASVSFPPHNPHAKVKPKPIRTKQSGEEFGQMMGLTGADFSGPTAEDLVGL